jgi:hypothetical protein
MSKPFNHEAGGAADLPSGRIDADDGVGGPGLPHAAERGRGGEQRTGRLRCRSASHQ